MSDNGWIKMHRGWAEHPIFAHKEFCSRMAWYWLIENACWKATRTRISGKIIELKRGQLSYSIRFLAQAWSWDQSRVRRFINALQTDTMIATATDTGQLLITICNYSKYQDEENNSTQQTTHERHSSDTNNEEGKNLRTEERTPPTPSQGNPDDKPKRSRRAATLIDSTFQPDDAGIKIATALGFVNGALEGTVQEFIDYWRSVGKPMCDWQAAFRNRLRQLAARGGKGQSGQRGYGREPAGIVAAGLRVAARYSGKS